MNFWLINYYAMPPKMESRLRTIKFAHYLKQKGHTVTIFASSLMHNMNIDLIEDRSRYIIRSYGDLNFVHIKTLYYKTNGLKRVFSIVFFHIRLHFLRNKFEKPDIILHEAMPPFGNLTYFTSKKLKSKYIVEVLDLWPESFVTYGFLKKGSVFLKLAYLAEKWLYMKADLAVFSMEGGKDYIIGKKWDINNGGPIDLSKVHYINNGVDLQDFDHFKETYFIDDPDLLDESIFKVIYLGSIRLVNNVKSLIDAASYLKEYKSIKFLVFGDGDDRELLEKYVTDNDIDNVVFKQKWIDPKYVPFVLSKSSLNILNYLQTGITKYGGSQSKYFQYLASGKPICSNIKMGYDQITKHKIGISQDFSSSQEYAEAILSFYNMDKSEYEAVCTRALNLSKEFDYSVLVDKFISIL